MQRYYLYLFYITNLENTSAIFLDQENLHHHYVALRVPECIIFFSFQTQNIDDRDTWLLRTISASLRRVKSRGGLDLDTLGRPFEKGQTP